MCVDKSSCHCGGIEDKCRLCRILVALTILWVVVAAARLAQEDVESHRPAYENCTSATSASGGVGL